MEGSQVQECVVFEDRRAQATHSIEANRLPGRLLSKSGRGRMDQVADLLLNLADQFVKLRDLDRVVALFVFAK